MERWRKQLETMKFLALLAQVKIANDCTFIYRFRITGDEIHLLLRYEEPQPFRTRYFYRCPTLSAHFVHALFSPGIQCDRVWLDNEPTWKYIFISALSFIRCTIELATRGCIQCMERLFECTTRLKNSSYLIWQP